MARLRTEGSDASIIDAALDKKLRGWLKPKSDCHLASIVRLGQVMAGVTPEERQLLDYGERAYPLCEYVGRGSWHAPDHERGVCSYEN